MGGRTLPTDCSRCGLVVDWGDFGAEDGSSVPNCGCPPAPANLPRSVWVEVSTELLAELGEWSDPVQVRIEDLQPNGQVVMTLRRPPEGEAP